MGTEISSYGYPSREGGPDKTILEPRLMRGHIQRNFQYEWGDLRRRYHAFELSFPVLPGQSGSPVFLDHEIRSTIAVLTTSFESSVVIDMYEEENQKNGENEIHKTSKSSLTGSGRRFGDMRTGYVREQARTVPDGLKVDEYFAAQEERSKSEGAVKKDETESGSTSPEGITAGAAAPSPP